MTFFPEFKKGTPDLNRRLTYRPKVEIKFGKFKKGKCHIKVEISTSEGDIIQTRECEIEEEGSLEMTGFLLGMSGS